MSKHRDGDCTLPENKVDTARNVLTFSHPKLTDKLTLDYLDSIPKGETAVSFSDAISAMHLAAKGGAKTILLVGMEAGSLSASVDKWLLRYKNDSVAVSKIRNISHNLEIMKKWLQKRYSCAVHSLSPFINFGMEGHRYKSFQR